MSTGANRPSAPGAPMQPLTSAELLAELEESRNRRLDNELDQLADGFADIMRMAGTAGKDKFQLAEEGFALETYAANILLAAESLMSLTSELKRSFVLNDTSTLTQTASQRLDTITQEQQATRAVVEQTLREMDALFAELQQAYYSSPYRHAPGTE